LELKKVINNVKNLGSKAIAVVGDIREEEIQNKIVATAKEKYRRIDVLVNNAGLGKAAEFVNQLDEDIDTMIDTNLKALIKMTRKVLPIMLNNNNGHIINISTSLVFMPNKIFSVYIATKAAVKNFSDSIRREMKKHGIEVTTAFPGPYSTHFHEVAGFKNASFKCFEVVRLVDELVKIILMPKAELIVPYSYNPLMKILKLLPFVKNLVIMKIERLMDLQLKKDRSIKTAP